VHDASRADRGECGDGGGEEDGNDEEYGSSLPAAALPFVAHAAAPCCVPPNGRLPATVAPLRVRAPSCWA